MKVRIRFEKVGAMKFIGHLDMMRYFQKAFRRADIDIQYSQGFSPHQLISFASPLGVGLTSSGEYMDAFIGVSDDSKTMIDRINAEMVDGVSILSYKQILDETKNSNAMSIVAAADYEVSFRENMYPRFLTEDAVDAFMSQERIMVTKKTKKSVAETDIKPMIYGLSLKDHKLVMKAACGSAANLRPELLVCALYHFLGEELDEYSLLIHRCDMYASSSDGSQLVSLDDLGVVIG